MKYIQALYHKMQTRPSPQSKTKVQKLKYRLRTFFVGGSRRVAQLYCWHFTLVEGISPLQLKNLIPRISSLVFQQSLVVSVIVALFIIGCGKQESVKQKEKEKVIPVEISIPRYTTLERSLDFTGTVVAEEEILIYPDLPGRFLKYLKSEGSYVKKNEPIAHLEREIPGVEYKPLVVKSPINGWFSKLLINKGEGVSPNKPIARVLDVSSIYVKLALPEKYSREIKLGDTLIVTAGGETSTLDSVTAPARITWLAAFLDPRNQTKQVKAKILDNTSKFQPGQAVKAKVVVRKKEEALVIPANAVMYADTSYVMLYKGVGSTAGGVAKKQAVTVGMSNGKNIEILSGLTPSDSVIITGQEITNTGDKVKIVESGQND